MLTVFDVAKYILEKRVGSPTSALKLQKLVYYAQAWSLVWDEQPLFEEKVEAWSNGPVVRELFKEHQGRFLVEPQHIARGDSSRLNESQKNTIDAVLEFYGDKSPQWLSDLTHAEQPWRKARTHNGTGDGDMSSAVITLEDMAEYYANIQAV